MSKNPQNSLQMTKRIAKAILGQEKNKSAINIDDEFVRKMGWESIQAFCEEYRKRAKLLNIVNLEK